MAVMIENIKKRFTLIPFFLIFLALSMNAATAKSPTNDEAVHLLRGYALATRGELKFQEGHPPVAHRLIGSLLRTDPSLPDLEALPSWESSNDRLVIARELLWNEQTNLRRVLFLGRLSVIFAGMLFGAALLRWTNGSLVMATLWAFAPNWIAHTSLATTDAMVTMTFALTGLAIWYYRQQPTWRNGVLAGVAVGLTLAAKVSGLLILPISGILLLTTWRPSWTWWESIKQWAFLLPVAALTVWAFYGFEVRPVSYAAFPLPAATYWDSVRTVFGHVEGGHVAFLQGEISADGWLHYFIIAYLVKTPLPVLLLLFASLFTLLTRRQLWTSRDAWLPATLLFVVASYSRLNIGYRHILPIVPFVWLLIVWGSRWWQTQILRRILLVLLVWYGVDSVWQAPNYISYFNLVSRGLAETLLGDSNIDWGQDFWNLLDYTEKNGVIISYSGFLDPAEYGLVTLEIDPETGFVANFAPANPREGHYAISVNHLQGTLIREPDAFAWFRDKVPSKKLGGSIYVYDVPPTVRGDWIAHCTAPLSPLQPEQVEQLVGQSGLRHLYFDCTQSWVFPSQGSGWYLLPTATLAAWVPAELATWESVYVHRPTVNSADYTLLYLAKRPTITTEIATFGKVAQLLDYQHNETEWITYWRVLDKPQPFLSILAHLYDDTPTPLAVADGLGFSSEQWNSADLILQRHTFPQSVSCENGKLATGLYDFTTGERIPLSNGETQLLLSACP